MNSPKINKVACIIIGVVFWSLFLASINLIFILGYVILLVIAGIVVSYVRKIEKNEMSKKYNITNAQILGSDDNSAVVIDSKEYKSNPF